MFWLVVSYALLWLFTFLPGWPADVAFAGLSAVSVGLLALELRFNWRHLRTRLFETFCERLYLINFTCVLAVAGGLSGLILFAWPWLSTMVVLLVAGLGVFHLGIIVGASEYRRTQVFPTFQWDLVSVYERSLNPNIRKTYGPFIYVIVPLFIIALVVDLRLLAVVIFLQLDNIYTRIRMTIPISGFLTTSYEKSVEAWLTLKSASSELSIPGLVVDKEGRIPREVSVQQDIVRIEKDDEWLTAVATVLKYCKYIVFDTHSVSAALRAEVNFVFGTEHLKKVLFVKRSVMDPVMARAAADAENMLGERRLFSAEEIARLFHAERSEALETKTRNKLLDVAIKARSPALRKK